MPLDTSFEDSRAVKFSVPADNETLGNLAIWMKQAAEEGYSLKHLSEIRGGDQRDPFVIGARITLEKK